MFNVKLLLPFRTIVGSFRKRTVSAIPGRLLAFVYVLALGGAWIAAPATLCAQNVQFMPTINTVAGSGTTGYTGDGGNALSATLSSSAIQAVTDANGNIFIADQANNVIRRVDAVTGIITTVAGGGSGTCAAAATDALGDGCLATQATISGPKCVRVFRGDIYICDNGNNYIRKVSGSTGIISVFAGKGGVAAPTPGKVATNSSVAAPQDIIFDPQGNAYIATASGKVYVIRIDAVTNFTSIVAGTGTAGNTGDGGPATSAELQTVDGLAMDSYGNLFLLEMTPNNVREVYASNGNIITYVGTSGSNASGYGGDGSTSNNALLNGPIHLGIDSQDDLFIADSGDNRVRMVTPPAAGTTYGIITTYLGNGTANYTGDGGPAASATIHTPRSSEVTNTGDLLVLDQANDRVRLVSPSGIFSRVALGSSAAQTIYAKVNTALTFGNFSIVGASSDFTVGMPTGCIAGTAVTSGTICSVPVMFQPTLAGLRSASLVFKDAAGNAYSLALSGVGNAAATSLLPGTITTIAGTGTAGNTGDSAAATAAQLNAPVGTAVDGAGNIYFADSKNNEVREILASSGNIIRVAGTGTAGATGDGGAAAAATLSNPSGLAVDGAGNLYIADTGNNKIRLVTAATGVISTFAGTGIAGYAGDGGLATLAQLSAPYGVAFAPSGLLYIADTGNDAVRVIGLRSGAITTVAGNGSPNFSGDGDSAPFAQLNAPTGVAVAANGIIYIADSGNQRVRQISSAGTISTIAGSGSMGFSGDAGPATNALLSNPAGVAVDSASNVYIADSGNNRVRIVSGGNINTVVGSGSATGYTGDNGLSSAATLSAPQALVLDGQGNLIVGDTANNVLRKINVSGDTLSFPNTTPTDTSVPQTLALYNSGNLPLSVASVVPPSGFTEVSSGSTNCNSSSLVLSAGLACQLSIAFTPSAVSAYSGNVVITDNAEGQASAKQNVAVNGMGAYVFKVQATMPATAAAGSSQSVTVTVTKPSATYTGTIHLTTSDPSMSVVLPADHTFTAGDAGQYVFTGVKLVTPGIQTITATDTTDSTVTGTASTTVLAGPASLINAVSGTPQASDITQAYAAPLVAQVTDVYGNPVSGASVTFTAPASGATATFAGSATATEVTNAAGQATSPQLMPDGVTGAFTISASVTGVSVPAVYSLSNTSAVAAGFTLTASTPSLVTTLRGTSSTSTLTITPVGGFNSPVDLTCSGAPATTSCSIGLPTLAPSGNGTPTTTTLTFQTSGPAMNSSSIRVRDDIFFAGLLLCFVGFGRRRKKLGALALFCAVCLLLGNTIGCADGVNPNYTPQGRYNISVTATSGSLTQTLTVTFFVAGE
jgi:hypothetical protein